MSRKHDMYEGKATLKYSFGEITIKVGVDGKVDQHRQVVDHMLSTATAAVSAEAIYLRSSKKKEGAEEPTEQRCETTVEFGEIQVTARITFKLTQHVSQRTINDLVFSGALPVIWQTAGLYLGNEKAGSVERTPPYQRGAKRNHPTPRSGLRPWYREYRQTTGKEAQTAACPPLIRGTA